MKSKNVQRPDEKYPTPNGLSEIEANNPTIKINEIAIKMFLTDFEIFLPCRSSRRILLIHRQNLCNCSNIVLLQKVLDHKRGKRKFLKCCSKQIMLKKQLMRI